MDMNKKRYCRKCRYYKRPLFWDDFRNAKCGHNKDINRIMKPATFHVSNLETSCYKINRHNDCKSFKKRQPEMSILAKLFSIIHKWLTFGSK